CGVFQKLDCNQGRQMLRASEAGLLAGLFPSPAFGTRRVQSAIRKAAIKYKVPYITTLAGAYNTVKGIAAARNGHGAVKSLQEYHASIEEV
ncbi:MAG: hypothetical protein IKP03_09400, partial [Fibrobacter sp.]|nr:hypothetical protein [Fibrobacter sp.]